MTNIYCVKCKIKPPTKDEKMITTKNNRNAITGSCAVYNTKNMFIKKQI